MPIRHITIYKQSGDTFTKLADPNILPEGGAFSVSFSTDVIYLAVGHANSPYITIYKRSGDTFTKLANPNTIPGSGVNGVSFSPDGIYLAATTFTSFPSIRLHIYKRSGDTFTRLADPAITPTGAG